MSKSTARAQRPARKHERGNRPDSLTRFAGSIESIDRIVSESNLASIETAGKSQRAFKMASAVQQNRLAEIKLRAERRAGEMLAVEVPSCNRYTGPALDELGISKAQSHRWQTIAGLPEEQFEQHVAEMNEQDKAITSNGIPSAGAIPLACPDPEKWRQHEHAPDPSPKSIQAEGCRRPAARCDRGRRAARRDQVCDCEGRGRRSLSDSPRGGGADRAAAGHGRADRGGDRLPFDVRAV